jgi:DNA-binding Lrp family transcriptional regulator
MVNSIDNNDLQILSVLDMDARATDVKIAKQLDLCTATVSNHINDMEESGIIRGYFARIDYFKLGYSCFRAYMKVIDKQARKEIIEYLNNTHFTRWCGTIKGGFNLGAIFWFKNNGQVSGFWDGFRLRFRDHIDEISIAPYFGDSTSGTPISKTKSSKN